MILTATDLKALVVLASFDRLARPGVFGSTLWPEKRRPPQAFARPAGRVLARLKKAGLAEYYSHETEWGWRITTAGKVVNWPRALLLRVYHRGHVATTRRFGDGFQPTPWVCPVCRKNVSDGDELRYDFVTKKVRA